MMSFNTSHLWRLSVTNRGPQPRLIAVGGPHLTHATPGHPPASLVGGRRSPCNPYFATLVPSTRLDGIIRPTGSTVVMAGLVRLGVRTEELIKSLSKATREGRMIRATALLLATVFVLFAIAQRAQAQQPLLSIDSSSTPLVESFDSMGSADQALLPTGWVVGTGTSFYLGHSHTDQSAGTTGLDALNSTSKGGIYNFANGDNA